MAIQFLRGSTAVYYLEVDLGMNTIPKGTLFVKYSGNTSQFNQITSLHLRHAFSSPGTTYHTYINLYDIVLPENASVGWFEIDLPEDVVTTLQKNWGITGVFKGYKTTLPLGYDGSNVVVDNTSYACIDINNNFLAKQTFREGIEVGTIKAPSETKSISITTAGTTKLNSFKVEGHYGDFSVTSTANWKNYGTYGSGGTATLSKFVLNKYYAFPTLEDYRVLATERPTNTTALSLPFTWTQQVSSSAAYLRGQYTWSGSYSYSETDLPHELLTRKDSYLSLNSMLGNSISSSYDMLTRYLVFQDPTYGYRFPNITLDKVFVDKRDENIPSSSNTTYYWGLSPAFWIAEDNESISTPTIVSIAAHVSNEWNSAWNNNLEEHRHTVTYYITAMGGPLA